jgi:hypothetical protein
VRCKLLCLVALAISVCAFFGEAAPQADTDSGLIHWGDPSKGCRIGLAFPGSREAGTPFDVDLYIQNSSATEVRLTRDRCIDRVWATFVVKGPDGTEVQRTSANTSSKDAYLRADTCSLTLRPGTQLHQKIGLNLLYDLSEEGEYAMTVTCSDDSQDQKLLPKLNGLRFRISASGLPSEAVERVPVASTQKGERR